MPPCKAQIQHISEIWDTLRKVLADIYNLISGNHTYWEGDPECVSPMFKKWRTPNSRWSDRSSSDIATIPRKLYTILTSGSPGDGRNDLTMLPYQSAQ